MSVSTADTSICDFTPVTSYSTGYHVGAVFIILASSVLGCSIPVVSRHLTKTAQHPYIYTCGKHIGTGVLLSLSLIHLLGPAMDELSNPCLPNGFLTYSYAPLFALLSAIAMHFTETVAFDIAKSRHSHDHTTSHTHTTDHADVAQYIVNGGSTHNHSDTSQHHHNHDAYNDVEKPAVDDAQLDKVDASSHGTLQSVCIDVHAHDAGGHVHGIFLNGDASIQRTISAYILEFGLTAHSVIIGITVGVADDTLLNTLLAALTFHQFFEGFALGARLATVGFNKKTEAALTLIYSVSAPVGIAIGMAVVGTYNASSSTANIVQGTFDAVSAGILLYVAFVQMLGGDWSHDYSALRGQPLKKAFLWVCMWSGAAIMAVIGIWL